MKKAVRIYIFGVVQGVLFRDFIKKQADKFKLKGYVRNKDDGSVEIWLEGNSSDIDKMIEICKTGPKHAIVKRLDIVDENFRSMKEFKIIRF